MGYDSQTVWTHPLKTRQLSGPFGKNDVTSLGSLAAHYPSSGKWRPASQQLSAVRPARFSNSHTIVQLLLHQLLLLAKCMKAAQQTYYTDTIPSACLYS